MQLEKKEIHKDLIVVGAGMPTALTARANNGHADRFNGWCSVRGSG